MRLRDKQVKVALLRRPRALMSPPTSNPSTPTANRRTTRLSTTTKNEHEDSSDDADSNPCFDEIPEDNPKDELEPRVGYTTRATRKADDLTFVSNWNSAVSTKQKVYPIQGKPHKRWGDDCNTYLQPDRSNRDNNVHTSHMTCLTTAEDKWKWDAMATEAHDQNEDDDTLLILSQVVDS